MSTNQQGQCVIEQVQTERERERETDRERDREGEREREIILESGNGKIEIKRL